MKRILSTAALVIACWGACGSAEAALLTFEPSSPSLRVGETVKVRLKWDGSDAPYLWMWDLTIDFDPTVIHLVDFGWGSLGDDQLVCPGPSFDTCLHYGSDKRFDFRWGRGRLRIWEASYAPLDVLDALQTKEFKLMWIQFVAVGLGSSTLAIEPEAAYFVSGPFGPAISATIGEGRIDVIPTPEPATLLLGLAGLAALAASTRRARFRGAHA